MNKSRKLMLMAAYAGIATMIVAVSSTTSMAAKSAERITANAVSLNPDDPNYYKSFAPELAKALARVPNSTRRRGYS